MASQSNFLNAAKQAAFKAGDIIRSVRAKPTFSVELKGENDPVTEADKEADAAIRSMLMSFAPESLIVSEEFSPEAATQITSAELAWIIDPLDGTVNFVHGLDQVGISIAWARQGTVMGGLVYAPFREECFWAEKEGGAFMNGQSIQVSGCQSLRKALVGTGFPYARDTVNVVAAQLSAVLAQCQDIRRPGAASLDLCWVARGWLDGFYETLMPWDMAAGLLIAREAGATHDRWAPPDLQKNVPDDICGEHLVVGTPEVLPELVRILRNVGREQPQPLHDA